MVHRACRKLQKAVPLIGRNSPFTAVAGNPALWQRGKVTPSFRQGCRKTEVFKMDTEQSIEVPESPLLRLERKNRYGSVPDLEDEELADPEELERCAIQAEWEPVLMLPRRGPRYGPRPSVDMNGELDWGAFGTVDFDQERAKPSWEKGKVQELRERLKDTVIMLSIVKERLPGMAAQQMLKWLRMGVVELEHIVNDDMHALAMLYLRARRLRQEIRGLKERAREREKRRLEAWLEA